MGSDLTGGLPSPVAIGGVGGSGTRLVAQILKELGFYMGDDLNHANDNLWFTLLFKKKEILLAADSEFDALMELFVHRMIQYGKFTDCQVALINKLAEKAERTDFPGSWVKERTDSLLATRHFSQISAWGWKEPNTHVLIGRLLPYFPNMKYIHVVRNGLDMAYSRNQNQVAFWGDYFFGSEYEVTPYYSLKYWHIVHERIIELCSSMGSRFLFLNYDNLCLDTENALIELLNFLEIKASDEQLDYFYSLVNNPGTIGRFRLHEIDNFDPVDILFVKQLGFDVAS